MAGKESAVDKERARKLLAERLKEIRVEQYGEDGGALVARLLKVSLRTWYNYERGETMPAEVILLFIAMTSVSPKWLLFGLGEKYRTEVPRATGDQVRGDGARLADLFKQVAELLEEGDLPVNVSWKKAK